MKYNILSTKQFIQQKYHDEKLSLRQTALLVGCAPMLIKYYLLKYNLPIRNKSETRLGKLNPNYKGTFHGTQYVRFGKKNHNYKDGRTTLLRRIYQSKKYKLWIKKVFERDSYICQECQLKKDWIEAHHKSISFVAIYEKFISLCNYPTLNKALKFKLFWDINNGITLCKDCHLTEHPRKRRKNGTFK